MQDIYILGSSGLAKEIFFLIKDINKIKPEYSIKGFIDLESGEKKMGNQVVEIFEESSIVNMLSNTNTYLALGIGFPNLAYKVVGRFKNKFLFPNLVHPNTSGDWDKQS